VISEVVARTEGFSGREINKLAVAWQAAAYGQSNATLNRALLKEVLDIQLEQKKIKNAWTRSEHETYKIITDTGSATVTELVK
jgi:ATPase family AAA domain-containing protein 3A/B